MQNPLFLNIDLTSQSPKLILPQQNKKLQKSHQHSSSNPPQLFIQSPNYQINGVLDRKHTPSRSQQNLPIMTQPETKEYSVNSRITNSSQSPASKKALTLKTEPSYPKIPPLDDVRPTRSPNKNGVAVKSFVKNASKHYYQEINQIRSPKNVTPKSRKSPKLSPQYQSEKQLRKKSEDHINRVRVIVRVKPLEQNEKSNTKVKNNRQILIQTNEDQVKQFEFNHVLDQATQLQTYKDTSKLIVDRAIQGLGGGVVFTYGQTGSGKTYTMGLLQQLDQGVVYFGMKDIFDQLKSRQLDGTITEYRLSISFVQIYLEEITDLLNPDSGPLQIREQKENQMPHLVGAVEVEISTVQEGQQLIDAGITHRIVASQSLNKNSSRSHTILVFKIEQLLTGSEAQESKVTFIDLAGSERIKKTNSSGHRITEAKAINSSLSALGNVIQALNNPNTTHIPYRDSKLTRILQSYMDGGSQVSVICTVSQSETHSFETLSTLQFAQRCKDAILRPNVTSQHQTETSPQSLSYEKEMEYNKKISDLEQQVKALTENSKHAADFKLKREQEGDQYQSLIAYFIKIVIKIKQFTNNVIDSVLKQSDQHKNGLLQVVEEMKDKTPEQEQLIDQYLNRLNVFKQESNTMREIYELEPEVLAQQGKNDITHKIQQISKALLQDVNQIHGWFQSEFQFQYDRFVSSLQNVVQPKNEVLWDDYIQYLVSQGVNREKKLFRHKNVDKEILAANYLSQQMKKARDLFRVEQDLGESLKSMNKVKSKLIPVVDTSFTQTVGSLRQFSNNFYLQRKSENNPALTQKIQKILESQNKNKHSMGTLDKFSFLNKQEPPPVYHSPQDDHELSRLMMNKKQQNLFNDISSLDNDKSDRQDSSKLLLDSFQAQNLSKQLENIYEEDEYDSKQRKQQESDAEYRSRQNLKPKEESKTSSQKDREVLDVNFQTLTAQIQKLGEERTNRSTVQTLARMNSKQNSREHTLSPSSRDGSIEGISKKFAAPPPPTKEK